MIDDDGGFWREWWALTRRGAFVLAVILTLLCCALVVWGQAPYEPHDPATARHAVVVIQSHGGSGTVIYTVPGRTLILSAAHMFQGGQRVKPIQVDAPAPLTGPPRRVGVRLLGTDEQADLALVELLAGPLPYCCPVASPGHQPSPRLLSVGYDNLRRPPQMRPATILSSSGAVTYTRELPWHGRSGGALIDEQQGGVLVGVVSAYTSRGRRTDGGRLDVIPGERGVYASHSSVLAFVRRLSASPATPRVGEYQEPFRPRVDPRLCPT